VASIKDLKKRITSTKNTQQTTKAMKMVSAAKLRRATDAILSQRPYAKEIASLMSALSDGNSGESADTNRKSVSLLVAFSSDRGLCGGYNSTVIKAASQFLTEKQAQGKAVKCVFVGKKVQEMIKLRFKADIAHYEEFGQKITFRRATDLAKQIAPLYDKGEVDEVFFVFNEFKNAITQEVKTEKVLPLADAKTTGEQKNRDLAIFVPSKKELYESLASKYFTIQIFKAFLEAQASEHGARMGAMENATKNAGDMIRKLTLQYNKQRQAGITKELLEIIAGSESQKTA
jgi:F-type H+-transporting ATPase subunit gamma